MREVGSGVDCCVVGGGVIGLSIARELAGRGRSVTVLSRGEPKDSSSWAAAGILPPAPMPANPAAFPGDTLTAMSDLLHRAWAKELLDETGIDNGLRACGGLHLAAGDPDMRRLGIELERWRRKGSRCDMVSATGVAEIEPALAASVDADAIVGGMLLADEMQMRPPRHLEALVASCRARGVRIIDGAEVRGFRTAGRRVVGVETAMGTFCAGTWVLAAGAWSRHLAPMLRLSLNTRPIRGQIVLLAAPSRLISHVLNFGLDYVVQRDDGRLLVGSTLEDAGFDPRTTPEAVERLLAFARGLIPELATAPIERSWAGLRPGSEDGLPFIGFVPGFDDAVVAAGHFRAGLHQSTGTAVVVADLVDGNTPAIDLAAFSPERPGPAPGESVVEEYLARGSMQT